MKCSQFLNNRPHQTRSGISESKFLFSLALIQIFRVSPQVSFGAVVLKPVALPLKGRFVRPYMNTAVALAGGA